VNTIVLGTWIVKTWTHFGSWCTIYETPLITGSYLVNVFSALDRTKLALVRMPVVITPLLEDSSYIRRPSVTVNVNPNDAVS